MRKFILPLLLLFSFQLQAQQRVSVIRGDSLIHIIDPSSSNAISNVIVTDTVAISADTTISGDRGYYIANNGMFNIANAGDTLTFSVPFSAGLQQVFTGSGVVQFSVGSVSKVFVEWFGTDQAAVNKAIQSLPATGGIVEITRSMTITDSILIDKDFTTLVGGEYTASNTAVGRTTITKDGSFTGIVVTGANCTLMNLNIDGAAGNTMDGISVESGRATLRNVAVHDQGENGIRIGRNSNNYNLWYLDNIYLLSNDSSGIYIHDDGGGAPDANAGLANRIDARSNGLDGIRLENTIDNQFIGVHAATNGGYGINIKSGSDGNNFWFAYLESNTTGEGNIESGAAQNFVWGVRQGTDDGWTIGATSDDNIVLGRDNSLNDMFTVAGNMSFEQLHIADYGGSLSGLWLFQKNGTTRDLEIIKKTTANSKVLIKSDVSGTTDLEVEDGGITATDATINGTIDVNGGDITMDDNRFIGIDTNSSFGRDGTAGDIFARSAGDAALVMDTNNDESGSKIKFMKDAADPTTATEVGSIDEAGKFQIDGEIEVGTSAISAGLNMGDDKLIARDVNAGLTASTTQTQGQGALTAEINEVATVANANDTVTLPSAVAGLKITIINNGANTLQIFPASGDNLGAGVDTATTLAAGSNVTYGAYDSTNWESI